MFVCNHCGAKFISPSYTRENVGFAENPYWENEYYCPKCHTYEDFEEYDGELTENEKQMADDIREQQEMLEMARYYIGRW